MPLRQFIKTIYYSKLRSMRKFYIVALLTILALPVSAQYIVWDGDFMIGFTAGAVGPFSVPQPTLEPGNNVKPGTLKRSVSPVFAFTYGMERELKGRLDFGFMFDASFSRERASVTYVDSANLTDMKQKSNVVEISEEIYLAYFLTEKLPIMAGVGFAESLVFGRAHRSDLLDLNGNMVNEGRYSMSGEYGIGGAISVAASVGAFYYFTNTFFVSLRLKMRYPLFDFFSTGEDGADAYLTKVPVTLTPVVTIGFRW